MGHNILIAYKERERVAFLRLAGDIVETGDRRGRPLSPGEDAMVVELLEKAQTLEGEITRLKGDQRRVIPSKHGNAEEI